MTSKSFNTILPIKQPDKNFKENYIFSVEKVVGSALELFTKGFHMIGEVLIKKYGFKILFLL